MSSFNSLVLEPGSTYRFHGYGILNAKLIGNFKINFQENDGLKGRVTKAVAQFFADGEDFTEGTIKLGIERVLKQFSEPLPSNTQDELYTDLIKAAIKEPATSRTWVVSRPFQEAEKTSSDEASLGLSTSDSETSDSSVKPNSSGSSVSSSPTSEGESPTPVVESLSKRIKLSLAPLRIPAKTLSLTGGSPVAGDNLSGSTASTPPKTDFGYQSPNGSSSHGSSFSTASSSASVVNSPVSAVTSPVSTTSSAEQALQSNNSNAQTPIDQVSTFNFIKTTRVFSPSPLASSAVTSPVSVVTSPVSTTRSLEQALQAIDTVFSTQRSNESGSPTMQRECKYIHIPEEEGIKTRESSFYGSRFFKVACLFLVSFFVALAVIFGRANSDKNLI